MDGTQRTASEEDIVDLAERLARRLRLTSGEQRLELQFSDGRLRRADLGRHAMKPQDLRELAR